MAICSFESFRNSGKVITMMPTEIRSETTRAIFFNPQELQQLALLKAFQKKRPVGNLNSTEPGDSTPSTCIDVTGERRGTTSVAPPFSAELKNTPLARFVRNAWSGVCAASLYELAVGPRSRETFHFDALPFVVAERARLGSVISVSPSLRMSREDVARSAFIVPSGALLTWMELLEDAEGHEQH